MHQYALHDLTLELASDGHEIAQDLELLLEDLSFVKRSGRAANISLSISVGASDHRLNAPTTGREVFRADGFHGLETRDGFCLTDGCSHFYLKPQGGEGYARVASCFVHKRRLLQRNFWAYGILKLLRPLGMYSLHAAGVALNDNFGVLVIGGSGSGKSTLAIGLIRQGWRYLSDDSLLIRMRSGGVEALALRKSFYVASPAAAGYSDFVLGDEVFDKSAGPKRRVYIEEAVPGQRMTRCMPSVLLFSRIVRDMPTALVPLDSLRAMRNLLGQSAPQLFDRATMVHQMEVLKSLVQQTKAFELRAGADLYRNPSRLTQLLEEACDGADHHGADQSL